MKQLSTSSPERAERQGPSCQGTEPGLWGMVLIPDSTQSWMKCRGCLSPEGGWRCWELRAFAGSLLGSSCCSGTRCRPAFVCNWPPGVNVTYFCKCFQSLPSGGTCPQKSDFPPSWLVSYHIIWAGSFSWFLSGAEEAGEKLLPWRSSAGEQKAQGKQ